MSGFLKDFGMILCTVAIVVGLLSSLTPNRSVGKTAKIALGLYMAIVLLTPFLRGVIQLELPQIEFSAQEDTEVSASVDAVIASEIENNISESVTELMSARLGVVPKSVRAEINIDQTGGIYCDRIEIELDEKYREFENQANVLIQETLAAEATFIYR